MFNKVNYTINKTGELELKITSDSGDKTVILMTGDDWPFEVPPCPVFETHTYAKIEGFLPEKLNVWAGAQPSKAEQFKQQLKSNLLIKTASRWSCLAA